MLSKVVTPAIDDFRELVFLASCAPNPTNAGQKILGRVSDWTKSMETLASSLAEKSNLALDVLTENGYDVKTTVWRDELEKMLTISTGHVTHETAKLLASDAIPSTTVFAKGEYGWLIYIPDVMVDYVMPEHRPAELHAAMFLAHKLGCVWLVLDCDAPEIEELPTFKW